MTETSWNVNGEYYETCSCDYVCPCILQQMAVEPTKGTCTFAAAFQIGGPMAGLSGLIGTFLGVESAPIKFERDGAKWSVNAASKVDMAAQAAMGINPANTEPLHLANTGHPASDDIALAHALKSHVSALGLSWDDTSGKNNGQYAPFNWRSA